MSKMLTQIEKVLKDVSAPWVEIRLGNIRKAIKRVDAASKREVQIGFTSKAKKNVKKGIFAVEGKAKRRPARHYAGALSGNIEFQALNK